MLPWNFMISINAFWHYKFRNTTGDYIINHTTTNYEQADFPVPTPIIKPTDMQVSQLFVYIFLKSAVAF